MLVVLAALALLQRAAAGGDAQALCAAAAAGDAERVQTLLREPAEEDWRTAVGLGAQATIPLLCAVLHVDGGAPPPGVAAVVDALVRAGRDVNAASPFGETALHLAALSGDDGAVEALLGYGADPRRADDAGRTPAHYAALAGCGRCLELIGRRDPGALVVADRFGLSARDVALAEAGAIVPSGRLDRVLGVARTEWAGDATLVGEMVAPTMEQFFREYFAVRRPVVVRAGAAGLDAANKRLPRWLNDRMQPRGASFLRLFGNETIGEADSALGAAWTMSPRRDTIVFENSTSTWALERPGNRGGELTAVAQAGDAVFVPRLWRWQRIAAGRPASIWETTGDRPRGR